MIFKFLLALLGLFLVLRFFYWLRDVEIPRLKKYIRRVLIGALVLICVGGVLLFLLRGHWQFLTITLPLLWLWGRRLFFGVGLFRQTRRAYQAYRNRRQEGKENQTASREPRNVREAAAILGVEETASEELIQQAWQDLIRQHHPDHGGDPDKAQNINTARDILLKNRQSRWRNRWRG